MELAAFKEVFLNYNFFPLYIKLISVFTFLTFNGFIIFSLFFKTRNKFLLLSGGMITGPLALVLILSIFSYIFKGPLAIAALFISYSLTCIYLFYKNFPLFTQVLSKSLGIKVFIITYILNLLIFLIPYKSIVFISLLMYLMFVFLLFIQNRKIIRIHFSKYFFNSLAVFLVAFIYVVLIWLKGGTATVGGDTDTYWAISTSFARGNYPTVLAWQPDFLTVYHEGAFMVQGVISSLANISIATVHIFFSSYIITGMFLFLIGLAREKTRTFLCLIPAIFGLIVFGGPLILIGGFLDYFSSFGGSLKQIVLNLASMPQFSDIKGSWGAGATRLDGLFYINYHAFGLAVFFLIVYAVYLFSKLKSSPKDYIVLSLITMLCLSIDETLFIPVSVIVFIFFLNILRKLSFKKAISLITTLLVISIVSFFVIQNLFRDSILTPSPEHSRFRILKLNSPDYLNAFSYGKTVKINSQEGESIWFMFNLQTIVLLTLVLCLLTRSLLATSFAITALISCIPGYISDNYFVHGGNIRFLNHAYNLSMFALGFLIISLKLPRKKILSLGLILSATLIFLPQVITSNARFLTESLKNNFYNYVYRINFQTPTHEWIKRNLPVDTRIIFVDEYPDEGGNSPATAIAQTLYGFFVPTAPPFNKVTQVDVSSEWYDAIISLAPYSLKDLKVNYVFIYNSALYRFSKSRLAQLSDQRYFEKVYTNGEGTLLKVTPLYKQLPEEGITFRKIVSLIPEGKKVYLDKFKISEMRKGFILYLSKRTKLYGPMYSQQGDYFAVIESDTPFNPVKDLSDLEDIDYVLMPSKNDPPKLHNYSFSKVAENPYLTLWAKQ